MIAQVMGQLNQPAFQAGKRKLKNGAVLARSEAQSMLTFIELVGKLLVSLQTEPLYQTWPKGLGGLGSSGILSELIVAFAGKRPGTAQIFHIDSTATLEIVLLELSQDPENPFDQLYCFRVNVGDWGITWKIGNLTTARLMIEQYIDHKEELLQQIMEAAIATDDLAPPERVPEPTE